MDFENIFIIGVGLAIIIIIAFEVGFVCGMMDKSTNNGWEN